jgi:phosphoglycerate dehydrogenase-like enzyme
VDALRRDFPDVETIRAASKAELEEAIGVAEILFSWAPGEAAMAKAARLRWLHAPAAGVGAYLTPSFLRSGAAITNSRGAHAIPISEHVLGMLIGLTRRLRAAIVEQTTTKMRRENWWEAADVPDEIHGKTLGLFGYGAIGREVARRARGFGMRVVALRKNPMAAPAWDPELLRALDLPAEEPRLDDVMGSDEFPRFLGQSDAIVVCAALTPETQGIFDARAFARMKQGALFLNVGRGKIVREAELVDALAGGHLGGAALDVFESEPLPEDSRLYTLHNVILTPHISGLSRGFWPRAMALFRANLIRYAGGLPLLNRVDPEKGY